MKPLTYTAEDRVAYVIMLLFLAAVIAARVFVPWPQ
jgi:hypothetical protein